MPSIVLREVHSSRGTLAQLLRHFDPDFVATLPNARSDGSENIPGLAPELCAHSSKCYTDDSCGRAAPSSVDSGHRSGSTVGKKDGQAIRSANRDSDPAFGGEQGIALTNASAASIGYKGDVGMDLLQARHCILGDSRMPRTEAVFETWER